MWKGFKISFITSKSRIAPLKKHTTIPRLELLGNLILSRLVVSVLCTLKEEMDIKNVICWSDSQISLAWIKAVDKEFKHLCRTGSLKSGKMLIKINGFIAGVKKIRQI